MKLRENVKEFEDTFKSMWKTAKTRGITKKDIRKEIEVERTKRNVFLD